MTTSPAAACRPAPKDWERLPPAYGELRDALGEAAAWNLIRALGGQGVYVPRRPRPEHRLARLLGEEAALALGEQFGGLRLDIPKADWANRRERARRIRAARDAGASAARIAREEGLTRRRVFQILSEEARA